MTGEEFRQKREALGLTISDLGHIIDVRQDTIRKWEGGRAKHGPHPTSCRVLDWMIAGYRPREWPQQADYRRQMAEGQ